MRYIFLFLTIALAFLFVPGISYAIVNPLDSPNNKYGVHIVDENDLDDAARLVNSSGGQWGYVTIVIRQDERDVGRWQRVFDRMREKKLIPVIRIATKGTNLGWEAPSEDAKEWVDFFDQLNWVVQNRYIILFNEPNHAKEWQGNIDPAGYAKIARNYYEAFKSSNEDYFILPAGFDQAAGDSRHSMSIERYFDGMTEEDPNIFTIFDGWTSHAYPNPNFSGSVTASGKRSVRGFEWEVEYLEKYGLNQNIPIFITETGWAHQEGTSEDSSFKSAGEVADLFEYAYQNVWVDDKIVMVSPFLLNYQDEPFDNFSWKKPDSSEYYPQFEHVRGMSKESGMPYQITRGLVELSYPIKYLTTNATFFVGITINNTGQSIWEPAKKRELVIYDGDNLVVGTMEIPPLKPFESKTIKMPISTPQSAGTISFSLAVEYDGEQITPIYNHSIIIDDNKPNRKWIFKRVQEFITDNLINTSLAVKSNY